jgi:hypothetical protein
MPAAMRSYPIVFSGPDFMPVAMITGIKQGENLFVDSDGRWAEPHYVPAYVQALSIHPGRRRQCGTARRSVSTNPDLAERLGHAQHQDQDNRQ